MSITGEPGGRGVRAGVSIADITAGMYAAFGILTALHARQTTGRGQFIDVSMLDGQLGILSGMIGAYLADGIVPGPLGTAYGALLPYQTFRTRTRDIAIGVGSDKLWRTFCPLLGLPQIAGDPRYATNARAQRQPPVAGRDAAGGVSDQDLRGVGSDPAAGGHPDRGDQHDRRRRRAPAGRRARRARRVHASGRRHDQDDRAAGAAVGDARRRARAGAAARRAHGAGAARAPRAWTTTRSRGCGARASSGM